MTPYERERRLAAHDRWCVDNREWLAGQHPKLCDAYINEARMRAFKTGDPALSPAVMRIVENRLASQLRVARHGPLPDSPEEALRQHNEIRAELGLYPQEAE